MTVSRSTALTCAALLAGVVSSPPARSVPPVPDAVRDADIAIAYDPKSRCPELTRADPGDRTAALVLFLAGPTGVPSRASVKSSSGSQSLDAAAVSCVQRLRFLPAVHAGDGNPIDSWQEIAWKWGRFHSETVPAAAAPVAAVTVAPPGASPASAPHAAEARVCLDAGGALAQEPSIVRSSGDASVDAAALKAARSVAPSSAARAGCLRVVITPEDTVH